MNIRTIQQADNPFLAKIIKAVFDEFDAPKIGTVYSDPTTNNLFELFRKDGAILWVLEENEEVLGCCGIYPTEALPLHCVELVKFYLSPKAREKGWGLKLMEKNIESAKEMGYKQMYIESLPHFKNAINMYKKFNFKTLENPLGESGHPSCDVWMLREL